MPFTDFNGTLNVNNIATISVKDSELNAPNGWEFKKISRIWNAKNLFDHLPTFDDVRQADIGDCFLLAALQAIIQLDPHMILRMIKDQRAGSVVVRIYHQGNPLYYQLEKTTFTRKNNPRQGHGAYWPYLFEKAYAVYRMRNHNSQDMLSALQGGYSDDAFMALLGGQADAMRIYKSDFTNAGTAVSQLLRALSGDLNTGRNTVIEVFGSDSNAAALDFLTHNNQNNRLLFQQQFMIDPGILRRELVLQWFQATFPNIRQYTRNKLEAWIGKKFPGKRGTGNYTKQQNDLFNRIHNALRVNQAVVISTYDSVGGGNLLGQTGEHVYQGLAGPHAYQVIQCIQQPPLRFIRLRNPWGHTGRTYVQHQHAVLNINVLQARQIQQDTFDLELSDLSKRFKFLFVGAQANAALDDANNVVPMPPML